MHLFVYGPLFFPEVWEMITPCRFTMVSAMLDGYACLRVKGQQSPALVSLPSAVTDGFLYKDVDDEIIARIDGIHGSRYQRQNVKVMIENGDKSVAATHVLKSKYIHLVLKQTWNAEVFRKNHIKKFIEGYQKIIQKAEIAKIKTAVSI